MSKNLGPESKIYEVLSLLADLVIINVLIILTSLPVLSAGCSLRAGFEVIGQMVREDAPGGARPFIKALPTRAGRTTAAWLVCVGMTLFACYDAWVIHRAGLGTVGFFLHAAVLSGVILAALIGLWFLHLDPEQPHAGLWSCFKNAAHNAVKFLPRSLVAVLSWVLLILAPAIAPEALGVYIFFFLAVGPALAIYLSELALQWPQLQKSHPA